MDADDIMLYNRIEKQIFCLMINDQIDVLESLAYSIDRKNKIIGMRDKIIQLTSLVRVIEENIFIHASVTGKRKWF